MVMTTILRRTTYVLLQTLISFIIYCHRTIVFLNRCSSLFKKIIIIVFYQLVTFMLLAEHL